MQKVISEGGDGGEQPNLHKGVTNKQEGGVTSQVQEASSGENTAVRKSPWRVLASEFPRLTGSDIS